jgi:hypothetical protein
MILGQFSLSLACEECSATYQTMASTAALARKAARLAGWNFYLRRGVAYCARCSAGQISTPSIRPESSRSTEVEYLDDASNV